MLQRASAIGEGYTSVFQGPEAGLSFLRFGFIRLAAGGVAVRPADGYEKVLVPLSGTAAVRVGTERFDPVGGRPSVFAGPASAVYVPTGAGFEVEARTKLELAVCGARAEAALVPFAVTPDEVVRQRRGRPGFERTVHDIVTSRHEGRVQRIVVGETFNEPGQWSSYPPHKHDRDAPPEEVAMEEIYHYRVEPAQGFGIQARYHRGQGDDSAWVVRSGDSFAIADGFHPVAAAAGYRLYYLWFMAGDHGRTLVPWNDPDHAWALEG